MKFWDSSALAPLIADEPTTQTVIAILATDPSLFVAFITPVEVESAIWRKAQRTKEDFARQRSQQRLAGLRAQWLIVDDFRRVLSEAHRVVARYGLRGADGIQLACALVVRPATSIPFVTLDDDLAAAARAEGFPVLP